MVVFSAHTRYVTGTWPLRHYIPMAGTWPYPLRIPLHKQELHHLLLLGSQCPGGLVALFNILIGEKRLRFVWVASSRGCPRACDRSLLINFGTDRLAETWMMFDKGKFRGKLRREERERGYNEKERERK